MKADYDLVVIGAGSAGLTAVRFARSLGLSVALVERSRVGGDCTWTGCVPSKALLKAAGVAHSMRTADRYGLPAYAPAVDLRAVMARIHSVIQRIYDTESPDALADEGVEVMIGEASFTGPDTIDVDGRSLSARRFLICTGASPVVPAIPGLDGVEFHTYETVWELEELPASLAVIGAGAVGCELSQAFARLGSQVTLIEASERILPQEDRDASEVIARRLVDEGVRVLPGTAAKSVRPSSDAGKGAVVELADGQDVEADELLVAVGRAANVAGLGSGSGGRHPQRQWHPDRPQPAHDTAADICGGRRYRRAAVHPLRRLAGIHGSPQRLPAVEHGGGKAVCASGRLHRSGNGAGRADGSGGSGSVGGQGRIN